MSLSLQANSLRTHGLAVVLWTLLAARVALGESVQPAALLDSKFPAEDFWPTAWIDNDRVLFTGVVLGTYPCSYGDPRCGGRGLENGAYIWNVRENRVTKYKDRILIDLCIQQGYVSYKTHDKLSDGRASIFAGRFSTEKRLTLPKRHWLNPMSCRYFAKAPVWAQRRIEGRRIQPLLDGDGFIDYGPIDLSKTTPAEIRNTPPVFWSADGRISKSLDIEPRYREVRPLHFSYAPFLRQYFARAGTVNSSVLAPAFYLSPEGQLRKVELPKGPWDGRRYFATREGILLISGRRNSFNDPGNAGAFLFVRGKMLKLFTGMPRRVSVSPDGCKAAFIFTWSQQAQVDGYKAWKQGKLANTLRMVDVCDKEDRK